MQIQQGETRYVSCENYRLGESLEFRALTRLRSNRTPRDKAANRILLTKGSFYGCVSCQDKENQRCFGTHPLLKILRI